jgi:hypothetical protein
VTSLAFNPSKEHKYLLSVYDGDMIQAEASHVHYTSVLQKQSIGVLVVLKSECDAIHLEARSAPEDFAEHAVIDFNCLTTTPEVKMSNGQRERCAGILRNHAVTRGWQYQPQQS